jgi:hypothetical protein
MNGVTIRRCSGGEVKIEIIVQVSERTSRKFSQLKLIEGILILSAFSFAEGPACSIDLCTCRELCSREKLVFLGLLLVDPVQDCHANLSTSHPNAMGKSTIVELRPGIR